MDESYKFVMHISILITNRLREEKLLPDDHKSIAKCVEVILDAVTEANRYINNHNDCGNN